MNDLFVEILQRTNHIDVISRNSKHYWTVIHRDSRFYYMWFMMTSGKTTKLSQFHETFTNPFIQCGSDILTIFCKAQQAYYAFSKLARKIKIQTAKISLTTDLYLNDIDTRHRQSICIHKQGTNYWFSSADLKRHIESALSNSPNFFSEPMRPRNPHTNIPFTDADVYNIYFHMKDNSHLFPSLLHGYVMSGLQLDKFRMDYEYMIRDTFLKKCTYDIDKDTLFRRIRLMLLAVKIHVNRMTPKDDLIEIMRPYFYLYMVSRYHICGSEKHGLAMTVLLERLNELKEFNPFFGRKICQTRRGTTPAHTIYHLVHPPFTMRDAMNMT